jgi:hypothetical protein
LTGYSGGCRILFLIVVFVSIERFGRVEEGFLATVALISKAIGLPSGVAELKGLRCHPDGA